MGLLTVFLLFVTFPALAQPAPWLERFLDRIPVAELFPGAERLGPIEGTPPVAPALDAGGRTLGYVFMNSDAVNATGYSGKPIHVAVGLDTAGVIVGARLIDHSEPIVLIGIPEERVTRFIQGYVGFNVFQAPATGTAGPSEIISGATVTVLVIGDTMVRASVKVARARGLGPFAAAPGAAAPAVAGAPRALDAAQEGTRSWEDLLGDGSIRRLHLTNQDVNETFERMGDERAIARPERGAPNDTFIDLYAALVSAPVIGRSLLGENEYARLRERIGEGQHAILVMGRGTYSFRGSGYVRGGIFDRIELVQDLDTVRFRDRDYERIGDVEATGAPRFPEIGLFIVPEGAAFEPAEPWVLQLLVQRSVGALDKVFTTFELPYTLPERYTVAPEPVAAPEPVPVPPAAATAAATAAAAAAAADDAAEPLWQRIWRDNLVSIGILITALVILTGIFFFQDWFARRPRLLWWVRFGFLAFTLLWLGWWANAQLSVVNILTLANALVTDFSWDFFLMAPLLFILWAAVAASLLFWGRGAFCGWLCPFGALQEFVSMAARRLKVPQVTVPWGLHERLWPIKYIIFLVLFGFSIYSLAWSERLAEVEPFKTAITLEFQRDWPFVLYAVLLLGAGLFIERFFCRYLCPLGAALAIPARMRTFEWLKRHKECGAPCQRCAVECPVASIHPEGNINPNECIYCMHCQTLYWDQHRCPHMIQIRLKRERAKAMKPTLPAHAITGMDEPRRPDPPPARPT